MEETEISVARWAEGNRSFSRLSLTNSRLSSRSPANRPEPISTGRHVPRAARAQSRTPPPVMAAAFGWDRRSSLPVSSPARPPKAAAITGAGVLLCALAAKGTSLPVLMASGLLAGFLDDSLELVSDKRLNDRFPSAQRATLISVSSMIFSVFMIPLSPLFGWWFS